MPGRRPLGPVFRDYTDEDPMSDLTDSLEYLTAGAQLGANLTHLAQHQSIPAVGQAVRLLTRDQLEATVMALVLCATQDEGAGPQVPE